MIKSDLCENCRNDEAVDCCKITITTNKRTLALLRLMILTKLCHYSANAVSIRHDKDYEAIMIENMKDLKNQIDAAIGEMT